MQHLANQITLISSIFLQRDVKMTYFTSCWFFVAIVFILIFYFIFAVEKSGYNCYLYCQNFDVPPQHLQNLWWEIYECDPPPPPPPPPPRTRIMDAGQAWTIRGCRLNSKQTPHRAESKFIWHVKDVRNTNSPIFYTLQQNRSHAESTNRFSLIFIHIYRIPTL